MKIKVQIVIESDGGETKAVENIYILTGSADILTIPKVADALAGRMALMTLWPLSMAEINGDEENIVDVFYSETFDRSLHQSASFQLYERMTVGGFLEPSQRKSHRRRQAWFESYKFQILYSIWIGKRFSGYQRIAGFRTAGHRQSTAAFGGMA